MQQAIGFNLEYTNPLIYIVFIGIVLFRTIAKMGYNSLIFVVPSERFPLNVKSTAIFILNIYIITKFYGIERVQTLSIP